MAIMPAMAVLSGCGGTSPLSRDTTLHVVATEYSGLKTSNNAVITYWQNLVRGFEGTHSHIKVDVQFVPVEHAEEEVAAMVKKGDVPDIAQLSSYSTFAAEDGLYEVDSLFPISMQSEFIPSLAKAGSVNRTQYGVPWIASTRMLFYNKKLFAEAGIKHPPQKWADIRRAAVKLRDNGVKVPFGLPLGPQGSDAEAMMWMLGEEGGYTDASGAYTFDSTANVKAFTWLKENLVEPGLVGPKDPATTNANDAFDDFLAGRTGMLNGHMMVLALAKAAGVDIGVVPLPGVTGPSARTLGNADWVMAFKEPGHMEADAAFLQYMYSRENMLKFQRGSGLLPVTMDTSQVVRTTPTDENLPDFLRQLPDAAFLPVNKISWVLVGAQLRKNIGKAVHGNPKAVLSELQSFAQSTENAR